MEVASLIELEAVNNIIGTIGESPINTLENLQDVDAINALRILRDISRREQARGWSFNIIPSYTLNPDVYTKRIPYLDNYLSIKGLNGEKLINYNGYIKDLTNDKTTFDSSLKVEIILLVPFENLPEAMRSYIIAKASFVFQSRYFGDEGLATITQAEIAETWKHLQEYEIDNNDYNILNNSHVQEMLSR